MSGLLDTIGVQRTSEWSDADNAHAIRVNKMATLDHIMKRNFCQVFRSNLDDVRPRFDIKKKCHIRDEEEGAPPPAANGRQGEEA